MSHFFYYYKRNIVFIIFIGFALLLIPRNTCAQSDKWILVIDSSKSIRGKGEDEKQKPNKNIFDNLKDIIKGYIKTANVGQRIYIDTFDEPTISKNTEELATLHNKAFLEINSLTNTKELASIIDNKSLYYPTGAKTYIAPAIKEAMEQAKDIQGSDTDLPNIVVFTDGIEDVWPKDEGKVLMLKDIAEHIKEMPPYKIAVVWLGKGDEETRNRVEKTIIEPLGGRAKLLFHPGANNPDKVTEEIRSFFPTKIRTVMEQNGIAGPGKTTQTAIITGDKYYYLGTTNSSNKIPKLLFPVLTTCLFVIAFLFSIFIWFNTQSIKTLQTATLKETLQINNKKIEQEIKIRQEIEVLKIFIERRSIDGKQLIADLKKANDEIKKAKEEIEIKQSLIANASDEKNA